MLKRSSYKIKCKALVKLGCDEVCLANCPVEVINVGQGDYCGGSEFQ